MRVSSAKHLLWVDISEITTFLFVCFGESWCDLLSAPNGRHCCLLPIGSGLVYSVILAPQRISCFLSDRNAGSQLSLFFKLIRFPWTSFWAYEKGHWLETTSRNSIKNDCSCIRTLNVNAHRFRLVGKTIVCFPFCLCLKIESQQFKAGRAILPLASKTLVLSPFRVLSTDKWGKRLPPMRVWNWDILWLSWYKHWFSLFVSYASELAFWYWKLNGKKTQF